MDIDIIKTIVAGATIAVGGMFPALSLGRVGSAAMEAIGRNPESSSKLFTPLILVAAFSEAVAIYALVVALVVKFV